MTDQTYSKLSDNLLRLVRNGLLGERGSKYPGLIIFGVVFCLVYLLSGILSTATSDVYRMGMVSGLVIPLIFLYGIAFDAVFWAYAALTLAIAISEAVNHSSLRDFVLFMRVPAFSYLMYYLARTVVNQDNVRRIVRIAIGISLIQLPVVLAQNVLVGGIDADYGTFNYKTDYAMAFFAIMILVGFLFGKGAFETGRFRLPIAWWLSLTVFVANAQITKLIVLMVWGVYLLSRLNLRRAATVVLFGLSIAGVLVGLNSVGALSEAPDAFFWRLPSMESLSAESAIQTPEKSYLEGGYDRTGAIRYFLSHPVSWFGDGPSKYYDVFTRSFTRGNMGQVYTFYSETGLVSLLLSFAALFAIAFSRGWELQISLIGALAFVAIGILSLTSHVMNDIAVMLIYSIVTWSAMLSSNSPMSPS